MASRIDRVEKEFILTEAGQTGSGVRVQASGRTLPCVLAPPTKDLLRFAPRRGDPSAIKPWETVSVYFDFRGQGVYFQAVVKRSGQGLLETSWPEHMYRGLSRRWPRIASPGGIDAGVILPDSALALRYPESREYADLSEPSIRARARGGAAESLQGLVESFRDASSAWASSSRVVMFNNGRAPENAAEKTVARLGLALLLPTVQSGLPVADPYPEGRVVTRDLLEEAEGPESLANGSPLGKYLAERSRGGLASALWCPIRYYRYTVGFVQMENDGAKPACLDFSALDYAWEYASLLAWNLDRYGYFGASRGRDAVPSPGSVLDASPSGLLLALRQGSPRFAVGSHLDLLLRVGGESLACRARVARRLEGGLDNRYGLAFEGLEKPGQELLTLGLYGALDAVDPGLRG